MPFAKHKKLRENSNLKKNKFGKCLFSKQKESTLVFYYGQKISYKGKSQQTIQLYNSYETIKKPPNLPQGRLEKGVLDTYQYRLVP